MSKSYFDVLIIIFIVFSLISLLFPDIVEDTTGFNVTEYTLEFQNHNELQNATGGYPPEFFWMVLSAIATVAIVFFITACILTLVEGSKEGDDDNDESS